MGIKISEMQHLHFLKGGTDFRHEFVEIAEHNDGAFSTKSVTTDGIASLGASFRTNVSTNQTRQIEDAGTIDFELGRIYATDLVREQIRYGIYPEYDPTDPYTFPRFNQIDAGIMHINLVMSLYTPGNGTKHISIIADGICDNNTWSFSGMNSKMGPIPFTTIPRTTPDPGSDDIWPTGMYFGADFDDKGDYLSIYTTIAFDASTTATFKTFGYIDTVLAVDYYN